MEEKIVDEKNNTNNDKRKLNTDQKIQLICLLISTMCIIGVVVLNREFTGFWKIFSICIFVQWLSLGESIRKSNSKQKRDDFD